LIHNEGDLYKRSVHVTGLCHYEELEDDGQEVRDEVYHSDDHGDDDSDKKQEQK
jgi:hypothetical protein